MVVEAAVPVVEQRYRRLAARAWTDPAFMQRLQSEPAAVLRESGFSVPDGVTVHVVERRPAADTDTVRWLVLPEQPLGRLSDQWFVRDQAEGEKPVGGEWAPTTTPPPPPPPRPEPESPPKPRPSSRRTDQS